MFIKRQKYKKNGFAFKFSSILVKCTTERKKKIILQHQQFRK